MASFVPLAVSMCRLVAVWGTVAGLPAHAAEPTPRASLDAGDAIQAAAQSERILFGAAGHPPALVEQAAQVRTEAVAATGDYAELARAWQRKQTLMRQLHGPQASQVAQCALELAAILGVLGQDAAAQTSWTQGLAITQGLVASGNLAAWTVLTDAAELARTPWQRERVADLAKAAVPVLQAKLDINSLDSRDLARSFLVALASMRIDMGQPADAIGVLTAAVQLVHPERTVNDLQTAEIASHLGRAHLEIGNLPKARQFLEYALSKLAPVHGEDSSAVALLNRRLGFVLMRQGQRQQALAVLLKARPATVHQRLAVRYAKLPAAVKLAAYNATFFDDEILFGLAMERALTGSPQAVAELTALELQRKGALLEAMARPTAVAATSDAAAVSQLQVISSQLLAMRRSKEPTRTPQLLARTAALASRRDVLQRQVMGSTSGAASSQAPTDLASLCKALPANAALIDYIHYIDYQPIERGVRLTRKMAALAVTNQPSCRAQLVDLGEALPVGQAVRKWRQQLQQSAFSRGVQALSEEPTAAVQAWAEGANSLYVQLVAPVEPLIGAAKTVLLSPDDDLQFLPFAALTDATRRLAGEKWTLAIVDSPRIRPLRLPTTGAKPTALVVGNPTFAAVRPRAGQAQPPNSSAKRSAEPQLPCAAIASTIWQDLPATQHESDQTAAELRKMGAQVTLLQKNAATESAFRHQAPAATWLSLSTHGFFAPHQCAVDADNLPRDPLLLSGVVLAGANSKALNAEDDGWVSAAEIATLDLSQVQLAVLSACETGLGDIQAAVGDGVFGLRRALTLAGVQGAVMSLWQVADRETAELMGLFWRNLTTCQGAQCRPYQALALAQAQMRQAMVRAGRPPHPYFWAGFLYAGGF